jgi:hypothetical protein
LGFPPPTTPASFSKSSMSQLSLAASIFAICIDLNEYPSAILMSMSRLDRQAVLCYNVKQGAGKRKDKTIR